MCARDWNNKRSPISLILSLLFSVSAHFSILTTIMPDESFFLVFTSVWTTIGAAFTFFSFCVAFLGLCRPDWFKTPAHSQNLLAAVRGLREDFERRGEPEAVAKQVESIMKALAPPGEPAAQSSWAHFVELVIELWLSAATHRETQQEGQGSGIDSQEPTPVLREILSELKQLKMETLKIRRPSRSGDPQDPETLKIQRAYGQLSRVNLLGMAPTEVLVRERMQAMFPSPSNVFGHERAMTDSSLIQELD